MKSLISFLFLCVLTTSQMACRERPAGDAQSKAQLKPAASSRDIAERITQLYPDQVFGQDLKELVVAATGKQVAEEARDRIVSSMTPRELHSQRIAFLCKTFSPEELVALEQLLSSPSGRGVLQKIPRYQEEWRAFLEPAIIGALSNAPLEAEKR